MNRFNELEEKLNLSVRALNVLKRAGITTIEELVNTPQSSLIRIRNMENYIKLKNLLNEYKNIKASTMVSISNHANTLTGTSIKVIKDGTFVIEKDTNKLIRKLDFVNDYKNLGLKIRGREYIVPIVLGKLMDLNVIDKDEMFYKLENYGYLIESVVDTKDAIEKIENVYNFKRRKNDRVYFSNLLRKELIDHNYGENNDSK